MKNAFFKDIFVVSIFPFFFFFGTFDAVAKRSGAHVVVVIQKGTFWILLRSPISVCARNARLVTSLGIGSLYLISGCEAGYYLLVLSLIGLYQGGHMLFLLVGQTVLQRATHCKIYK